VTGADAAEDTTDSIVEPDANSTVPESQGMGGGMGGGMGQGMGPGAGGATRMFHMTPIPEEYAGLTSPTPYSEESIARGEPVFQLNCSPCHGESGMGDGPAAVALDPAPPPIAMTSQMLGDDYLFWRISEGGAMDPFNSAMPSWKAVLDEDTRWDVINYVRSLGRGDAAGSVQGGGPGASAEAEAQMRAEVLASAVEQGVLTQEQADLFDTVHGLIDDARAAEPDRQIVGTMRDLQDQILQELVADGTVTEEDAQTFNTVLDTLQSSDLMQ
jgi:mono/diheme cytochrome c family protein